MRNKSKIKIIIITLGTIFTLLTNSSFTIIEEHFKKDRVIEIRNETKLKSLRKSGGYSESFIHIDGSIPDNWSDTATSYDWCSGDGSWTNPYTIENVSIDASSSPTGSGILINNSKNEHFIIRNCTVHNASSGGIRLENTNKGSLINNNCTSNDQYGIILHNNCINNSINDNVVNDTMGHGILLREFCENNTVSGNNVRSSNTHGIHVRESSSNNIITGNIVDNNGWNGIRVRYSSNNNNISGNTVSNNGWEGIYLDVNCDNNLILGNTITNNGRDGGIFLDSNCDNNTISGNTAKYHDYYGIYLYTECDNNLISGNTINDNYLGINLYANCDNNTISGNLVKNNYYGIMLITAHYNLIYQNSLIETGGWHAYDTGLNNHWNNSILGNYWDNHTSPDSNNDGIVDNPYTWIMGSAESNDYFPLVESPIHLGERVHIDDSGVSAWNWSKTARCKVWCTGSGTYSDPYVIEGVEINASGTGNGIYIENSKNNYFIIQNCIIYNVVNGIMLENTDNGTLTINSCKSNRNGIYIYDNCKNNTISNNTADGNTSIGIFLELNCDSNFISGNTANNNGDYGIGLYDDCDNNIISGNTITNNIYMGIRILSDCNYNNISGNTITNTDYWGIELAVNCDNNTILGNTVSNNGREGIHLQVYCDNNTILGNTVSNNSHGIKLEDYCNDNTISGNTITNNIHDGIQILSDCNDNTISGNFINYNDHYGVLIDSSDDNLMYLNEFIENGVNAFDSGENYWDNGTIGNYWDNYPGVDEDGDGIGDIPYVVPSSGPRYGVDWYPIWDIPYLKSFFVEIIDQSFSTEEFNITFYISNETNHGIDFASIQMWWNGTDVSDDVINLENGFYFVSLEPITIASGEDPILLNMTISVSEYEDKYFETYIAVKPCEIVKFLNVEITESSYSIEYFNFTFYIYDETGQGIDSAAILIWWNSVDVSDDVQNLGDGLYFISLEPKTVAPGEDPILLKMVISASGYEDKLFETYLTVDPATLEKEVGKGAEGIPLVIILIAIISTSAGIVVATAAIFLLRKRKRASEVI